MVKYKLDSELEAKHWPCCSQTNKRINKLGNPARPIDYYKSYTGDSSYRCQFIEVLDVAFLTWFLKEAGVAELLKNILSLNHAY